MLWKLSNPLYTATKVFTESDATCSAPMVKMAPDPDQFQAGGSASRSRRHSHVSLLDAYFAPVDSLNTNSKRVKTSISHGIKLLFVAVPRWATTWQVTRQSSALQPGGATVVKRMLTKAMSTDNVSAHL